MKRPPSSHPVTPSRDATGSTGPRIVLCLLWLAFPLAEESPAQRKRGYADTVPTRSDTPPPSPGQRRVRAEPGPGRQSQRSAPTALGHIYANPSLAAEPDKTVWQFWWRHNRHAYLDLKARLHTVSPDAGKDTFFLGQGQNLATWELRKPSPRQTSQLVIPALLDALQEARSPELIREALLALARVAKPGGASGPSPHVATFEAYLAHGNEWLAETAAVTLGVLGDPSSTESLASLMKDDGRGRDLVSSSRVPMRVRACAAYGLGLIGSAGASSEVRRAIAEHLMDILTEPHFATRDLKVAAMIALGMTPVDWRLPVAKLQAGGGRPNYKHALSRRTQLEFLLDYFDPARVRANRTARHWLVRAHAPAAMARLCRGGPEVVRDRVAELLLSALATVSVEPLEVRQGCVLALGVLGDCDALPGSIDARIRAELSEIARRGETQTSRFALIALAQSSARPGQGRQPFSGLGEARAQLLEQVSGGPSPRAPWAALALGIMGYELLRQGQSIAPETLKILRGACSDNRRPNGSGAHMVALGLLNDRASVPLLTERLDFFSGVDGPRCSAATALGLTGDPNAQDALRAALDDASHRPFLMVSVGTGLGLCGDATTAPELIRRLTSSNSFGSQAPAALALAQVGDSRSIPALARILSDGDISDWTRALVASALGSICDKDPLPWTARISAGVNYRASTVTLTDEDRLGVLDYL